MEFLGLRTHVLEKKCNLIAEIEQALKKNSAALREGDVIIISSKIVALSQGRVIHLSKIKPGARALKIGATHYGHGPEDPRVTELVLREADHVIPGKMLLTLKDGMFIASAGIDLSNAPEGLAILWPTHALKEANTLWRKMRAAHRLKNVGVVICDSHCQPLRWGTTGLAIAWAGFKGIEDARGTKDIYGKKLAVTRKAVADNLASAALLLMGEADEKIPFVLARNAPVSFTTKMPRKRDMTVAPEDCIFSSLYNWKEPLKNYV